MGGVPNLCFCVANERLNLPPNLVVMKYPRYPIVMSDNSCVYMFFSEGPRGKIKKGVLYSRIDKNLFNLGFGDWSEGLLDLDDSNRSNNGDRDKVLITVAHTALSFTDAFPNARIFVTGSTASRTRLYQMGIAANLLEVSQNFEVQGFVNGEWELFRPGRNYEAFLISRK